MTASPPDSPACQRLVEELLEQLTRGRAFDELLDTACEQLRGLVPCDRLAVAVVVPPGDTLRLAACRGGPEPPRAGQEEPLAGSPVEELLRTGQPQVLNDLAEPLDRGHTAHAMDVSVHAGMRSRLTLPLIAGGQPLGVLFLFSRQAGAFEETHLPLLRRVAGPLALGLEKAQLLEALHAQSQAHQEANALKAQFAEKLQQEVERRTEELRHAQERYQKAFLEITRLKARVQEENVYLRDEIRTGHDVANLVGDSPALRQVREAIAQVAPTDSTVLIVGETGTGKELIARAVHELSRRKKNLLVKVNCAALAPGVIASELFGHEAGAFTGALRRRLGRFELAQRGSLFLDEVAEVPPETQVLLLRVLQERSIERVGGAEPVPVDVRLIAATNRDLHAAVADGSFRSDLFYRLNVFPIRVPPLRERREDVPALVEHFVRQFSRRMGKPAAAVSRRSLDLLTAYDWPGNVRELENLVERALILCRGDTLEIDPTWLAGPLSPGSSEPRPGLAELERRTILETLERCGGKIYGPDGAAAALGLKPTTLYGKMRKHHIRKKSGPLRFE